MGHLAFQHKLVLILKSIKGNRNGKATVMPDLNGLPAFDFLAGIQQRSPSVLLVGQYIAAYLNPDKAFLGERVFRECLHIRFQPLCKASVLLNLLREVFQQIILQPELLALVVCFHDFEPGNVHVQIHALLDTGVSGTKRLDFRKGKSCLVHVVAGAHRGFRCHDLADKFLLVFNSLPEVSIKRTLRDIPADMDFFVLVALSLNTPFTLGKVTRPPRTVEVMERDQPVLDVGASAHFCRRAEQHPHLSAPNFSEKLLFADFRICTMDKCNLFFWHPSFYQFLPDVVVNGEVTHSAGFIRHRGIQLAALILCRQFPGSRRTSTRRGDVAENELGQLIGLALAPELQNILDALVDLCTVLVGEHGIDNTLVKPQLAPIRRDLEHIVLAGVNTPAVDFGCPFRQCLYHVLLDFRGFGGVGMVFNLRRGKMELVCRFDVRNLFEHIHKLREIEELSKPCPRPVACAFRRKLQSRGGLTETGSPAVEMPHTHLLQTVILQIPLDGVKLRHAV